MKNFKSHLVFNKQQQGGILLLTLVILVLLGVYFFIPFSEDELLDISSPEIQAVQKQIDSLRTAEIASRKPKQYSFNPNFISDYKAYTLGMSPEEFDRLKLFRDMDQWINSAADFKRVTQVSDSLLNAIKPYFKFPDWVTNSRVPSNSYKKYTLEKSYAQKIDLNLATEAQLQEVPGIGETLSKRIVAFRSTLNGFTSDIQLYGVWGLNGTVVQRCLQQFTVKTPKAIEKMDLNTATASDIATIPGVSFELAKQIWEYRTLRETINNFSELREIEGMSAYKLELIQLYLSIK
ncbi:DNA uptake protein ComE-like DNA-binding protein [Ulvibacter sp. MAR_2010_11]|uniref:ComEA family DNA-binding protein n=1 Tax=Ulvibacter sp. MAR_2010_11 TaxID=1250229 RepID=UPI000C2B9188|nr:helix-hairpin-helix domain-containing protein [Ulvibacter sp. MAR_2010_11]PKA83649.1 DNA uptake protein ComE-like DNA-binding protein [Ulvibacter sp. MAR_2010_11]